MSSTTRITVLLPSDQVTELRKLTDDVSGYVAEAVAHQIRHELLGDDLRRHEEGARALQRQGTRRGPREELRLRRLRQGRGRRVSERIKTVVLDSEGLSTWIAQDRKLLAVLQMFHDMGADLVNGANTIVEVSHSRTNMPRLNWALSRIKVEPVTEQTAKAAAALLKDAGLHGHKYAIGATVAEVALRQPKPVAEFPAEAQARTVLGAIGHGERTFTLIGRAAGGLNPSSVSRSLELLTSRRMVAAERPLSTKPSRETRYRIDDPYLRFWLSFIGPGIPAIERGRGDRVLATIRASWTSWRGTSRSGFPPVLVAAGGPARTLRPRLTVAALW